MAQTPAVTFDNLTSNPRASRAETLGWSFDADTDFSIGSLGLFDSGQNGLLSEHEIGIWDSGGNLLTSGSIGGLSGTLIDQFRYIDVTPITVHGGETYFVGATYSSLDPDSVLIDILDQVTGFATDPSITFGQSLVTSGFGLLRPTTNLAQGPGYFGPNFLISPAAVSAVPEPGAVATAASFAGSLALGMVRARRLRKAAR